MNVSLSIETPEGVFVGHYSEHGLAALSFPLSKLTPHSSNSDVESAKFRDWHALTTEAVRRILAALVPDILPPLDLAQGTDFQRSVWRQLLRIPFGETRSYADVARNIGNPGATRAVGSACGANPIPLIIPCHRVLAAGRRIGGFSGGLDWKHKLLALEGVELSPERHPRSHQAAQQELFVAF